MEQHSRPCHAGQRRPIAQRFPCRPRTKLVAK